MERPDGGGLRVRLPAVAPAPVRGGEVRPARPAQSDLVLGIDASGQAAPAALHGVGFPVGALSDPEWIVGGVGRRLRELGPAERTEKPAAGVEKGLVRPAAPAAGVQPVPARCTRRAAHVLFFGRDPPTIEVPMTHEPLVASTGENHTRVILRGDLPSFKYPNAR